jgi:hypothetical protein
MWKRAYTLLLPLLALTAAVPVLTGCDPDYYEAGRRSGEVGATAAAEVQEHAPTVISEVEEQAPTVAAEAADAAREFSEGVQESGACSGAAMALVGVSLIAAILQRHQQ